MAQNRNDGESSGWHADKRIPIAVIVTIILQTAGIVWWASWLESRVVIAERDLRKLELQADKDRDEWRRGLGDLRTWMESRFDRIENKIDGKQDRQR